MIIMLCYVMLCYVMLCYVMLCCVGSTGRSVVDYVISNPALFDVIRKFRVCEPNILSDHCVLEFPLEMYTTQREERELLERLVKNMHGTTQRKTNIVLI